MKYLTTIFFLSIIVVFASAAPKRRNEATRNPYPQTRGTRNPYPQRQYRQNQDAVVRYRTFKNTEPYKGLYIVPHTGIEVQTANGQNRFIHNNGGGTDFLTPSSRDMRYSEWKKPVNPLTPQQLREIGGSDYNLL
uniref:Uncharacterized protein n=1 Tax=Panagrolaimus davidi TaxID=227884 RepID=A0A914NZE8_9BILA